MRFPEADLQRTVVRYLDTVLDPNWTWFTSVDHSFRGKLRGGIMVGLGVKRGQADIQIFYQTQEGLKFSALFIELKAPTGKVKLSESQIEVHGRLNSLGAHVRVCRNLNEVDAALIECAVPMRIKR